MRNPLTPQFIVIFVMVVIDIFLFLSGKNSEALLLFGANMLFAGYVILMNYKQITKK